ncbi:MAG: hypothetical protein N3F66_13655 [Spirochaetes bacterium]|nr:hypothetical protein [Spirochaetota bacterium]
MMRIFRVRFCNKLLLIIAIIGMVACGKESPLQFCEGVDKDGKPVNCGSQFTTGDMTLYVSAQEPFGSDRATVIVYEQKKYSQPEYTRFEYAINPDMSSAAIPFSIYAEGTYIVSVTVKEKEIAKGTVTIVDTY